MKRGPCRSLQGFATIVLGILEKGAQKGSRESGVRRSASLKNGIRDFLSNLSNLSTLSNLSDLSNFHNRPDLATLSDVSLRAKYLRLRRSSDAASGRRRALRGPKELQPAREVLAAATLPGRGLGPAPGAPGRKGQFSLRAKYLRLRRSPAGAARYSATAKSAL